jgi:hypothetical protein
MAACRFGHPSLLGGLLPSRCTTSPSSPARRPRSTPQATVSALLRDPSPSRSRSPPAALDREPTAPQALGCPMRRSPSAPPRCRRAGVRRLFASPSALVLVAAMRSSSSLWLGLFRLQRMPVAEWPLPPANGQRPAQSALHVALGRLHIESRGPRGWVGRPDGAAEPVPWIITATGHDDAQAISCYWHQL